MLRSSPAIRAAIEQVSATAEPRAALALAPACGMPWPVAVLAGAFDPPTRAHLALARAALRGPAGTVLFSVSLRTVDKADRAGTDLARRLAMLRAIARGRRHLGVLVTNAGLYVDQARALERLDVLRPFFLVGFDKIPQVFDPRYYRDRDAALADLFARARFLVAPRDADGAAELGRYMAAPERRAYAADVVPLPVPDRLLAAMRDVSSTRVRQLAATGGEWAPLVPSAAHALYRASLTHRGESGEPDRARSTR